MYAPCEIAAPLTDEPEAPFAFIPLRDRRGQLVAFALIDAEDEERIAAYRWHRDTSTGYVSRNTVIDGRRRRVYLHREVLGLRRGDGLEADHKNARLTDCRKANLRVVTHAQNHQNRRAVAGKTSRHRGVSWDAPRAKWLAQMKVVSPHGALHLRRRCSSEEEAAALVAAWRREHMPYTTN